MGKVVILVFKALLILINTLVIVLLLYRGCQYIYFLPFFTEYRHEDIISEIFMAFSSAFVIFCYYLINNKIITFFKTYQPFVFLFIFCSVYYFIYFSLKYFGYFTLPLCFLAGFSIHLFNNQLKYVLFPSIATLFAYMVFLPYDFPILKPIVSGSLEVHYVLSLGYFGVFHFFLILFNIKRLAKEEKRDNEELTNPDFFKTKYKNCCNKK